MNLPATRFSCKISICSKIFPAIFISVRKNPGIQLSTGIFLDLSDFKPEKIRPENFQSKNFYNFQLSRQKFSGKKNFAARKSTGFRTPWPALQKAIYDGDVSKLPNLQPFFQLSRQLFFLFSIFDRKIFLHFKFRAEKNPAQKLSRQKRSVRTNFRAGNFWPGKISIRTSGTRSAGSDPAIRKVSVVRPKAKSNSSNFRGDLFKIIWREIPAQAVSCT